MDIINNPLPKFGMTGRHDTDKTDIRLREEITLVTLSGGNKIHLGDHEIMLRESDRSVMLKMKVAPASEAFK